MTTRRERDMQLAPRRRLSDRPFTIYPEQMGSNGHIIERNFGTNISNEFRFLDEEWSPLPHTAKEIEKTLERKTKRRLLGQMFAIIFCVCEVLTALGLLIFGAIRISSLISIHGTNLSTKLHSASDPIVSSKYRTAGACIEESIFLSAAGIVGILAFSMNSLGLCVVHMILGVGSIIFCLYAVLISGQAIAVDYYYSLPHEQVGLSITLTVVIASATLILLVTSMTQTSYMISPSPSHYKIFPIAPLAFCILSIALCTILIPLSSAALKQAIEDNPNSTNVSQRVYLSKIQLSTAPLVCGLYTMAICTFGTVACIYKSRPLLLSMLLLMIPSILVLIEKVLIGFANLIPDLQISSTGYTEVYLALFAMSFVTEIGSFVTIAVVGGHVYKKRLKLPNKQ